MFVISACYVRLWVQRDKNDPQLLFLDSSHERAAKAGVLRLSPLQPLAPLEGATLMSSSAGWTACASPCAGAATGTQTAWT